jgi:hypothetical protein
MKKEAEQITKKMFLLNPTHVKVLPIMVVIIYDASKGKTYHDAKAYSEYLKN